MKKFACYWISLLMFIVLVMGFGPSQIIAADFRASTSPEGSLKVEHPEKPRNLFVFAQNIIISAEEVSKDLFAFGYSLKLLSRVENNIFAAGKMVLIDSEAGGNVFASGLEVILSGRIDGDVFIAANLVEISESAQINGELYVVAQQLILNGVVRDRVSVSASEVQIGGNLHGAWNVFRTEKALEIKPTAQINSLSYYSPYPAKIEEGAQVGDINFTAVDSEAKSSASRHAPLKAFGFFAVLNWLASLTVGILLVTLLKKHTRRCLEASYRQFGISLASGISFFIGLPIAIIFLLFTFIGFKMAILGIQFFLIVWNISSILAGIFTGVLLLLWTSRKKEPFFHYINWGAALLGITVFQLLFLIPVAGWLTRAVLLLAVIGGTLSYAFHSLDLSAKPSDKVVEVIELPENAS